MGKGARGSGHVAGCPVQERAGARENRGRDRHYSREWKGFERVQKWALLEEDFSAANDMLTPKMSVKRRNVVKVYGELIESLYK